MTREKDVVCGMMVDPQTAPAEVEYLGQTYYFCAPGCKVAFEKDPGRYLRSKNNGARLGGRQE